MGGVVKKAVKTVGKVIGFDPDAARDAAESAAAASKESAQATVDASKAQIEAGQNAARQSAALQQRSLESSQALSRAQEQALANSSAESSVPDVDIGAEEPADDSSEPNRRRKVRDQFQGGGAGIRIA